MKGKEKCRALKEIRRQIAEKNDIPFAVSQCSHQGDCKGTCPKCEAELKYLERELAVRQGLGKAVAIVGVSAALSSSLTACTIPQPVRDILSGHGREATRDDPVDPDYPIELEGDIAYEPDETDIELAGDIEMPEPAEDDLRDPDEVFDIEGEIAYEPDETDIEPAGDIEMPEPAEVP